MTRYEQIKALYEETQALAVAACEKEQDLVGAGPITLAYADQLQDAADALEAVMLAMTPVPACGVSLDVGIVSNRAHRDAALLSPERAANRLARFVDIGDEPVLVYADGGLQAHAESH